MRKFEKFLKIFSKKLITKVIKNKFFVKFLYKLNKKSKNLT